MTSAHTATELVVAWIACRLNCGSATAFTAAISTGRYAGSQPAATALTSIASTVATPKAGATTATIESTTRSGYFPGARPVTAKLLAERRTGRLLGGQLVGGEGAAKRIDVVAVALQAGMAAADLVDADLAYAPPFGPLWDPVAVAARDLLKHL